LHGEKRGQPRGGGLYGKAIIAQCAFKCIGDFFCVRWWGRD
jgi:hypothetical protein